MKISTIIDGLLKLGFEKSFEEDCTLYTLKDEDYELSFVTASDWCRVLLRKLVLHKHYIEDLGKLKYDIIKDTCRFSYEMTRDEIVTVQKYDAPKRLLSLYEKLKKKLNLLETHKICEQVFTH